MMGFDRIAKQYDTLARLVFGKSLINAQTCFLNCIPPAPRILVLGGGTGWWLNELLRFQPACQIVYIDESSEMIRLAKKSSDNDQRILFLQGTHECIRQHGEFDAVILFCFLDLFSEEQLQDVLSKIMMSMNSNGFWLVADFIKKHWWHSLLVSVMYRFFRLATGLKNQKLPDWQVAMHQIGLKKVDDKLFFGGFIKSAVYRQWS